jgi:tetratricopeptide (TPR) repeat protein
MVANSWSALGSAELETGSFAAAAVDFGNAAGIWVETDGPGNPMALAAQRNRIRALESAGSVSAAESWEAFARDLQSARGNPRTLAGYRVDLALHRLASGRADLAATDSAAALAGLAPLGEEARSFRTRATAAQGRALLALGRKTEAQPLLEAALRGFALSDPDEREEVEATRRALGLAPDARPVRSETVSSDAMSLHAIGARAASPP